MFARFCLSFTAELIVCPVVADDVLPTITCPSAVTHTLSSNVSEAVTHPTITTTHASGVTPTVTFDPAKLDVGPEDIGKSFVITATATDPDGNNASCTFMIFVKGICSSIESRNRSQLSHNHL